MRFHPEWDLLGVSNRGLLSVPDLPRSSHPSSSLVVSTVAGHGAGEPPPASLRQQVPANKKRPIRQSIRAFHKSVSSARSFLARETPLNNLARIIITDLMDFLLNSLRGSRGDSRWLFATGVDFFSPPPTTFACTATPVRRFAPVRERGKKNLIIETLSFNEQARQTPGECGPPDKKEAKGVAGLDFGESLSTPAPSCRYFAGWAWRVALKKLNSMLSLPFGETSAAFF